MQQIDVREGARRQHRAVGLYCVIQCWLRDLDGLALERKDLERLLGLERFKRRRVQWLREDIKEFFPYERVSNYQRAKNSLASFYIARVPFEHAFPRGVMNTAERVAGIKKGGIKMGVFRLWPKPNSRKLSASFEGMLPFFADHANYDERFLSCYLGLLAQGQVSAKSLPAMKDEGTD